MMMIYKRVAELKAEHKELQEQLEKLNSERFSFIIGDGCNYYNKTREMCHKILSMGACEHQLYQLIGSEAPILAPFMYIKYEIDPLTSIF